MRRGRDVGATCATILGGGNKRAAQPVSGVRVLLLRRCSTLRRAFELLSLPLLAHSAPGARWGPWTVRATVERGPRAPASGRGGACVGAVWGCNGKWANPSGAARALWLSKAAQSLLKIDVMHSDCET